MKFNYSKPQELPVKKGIPVPEKFPLNYSSDSKFIYPSKTTPTLCVLDLKNLEGEKKLILLSQMQLDDIMGKANDA